VEQRIVGLEAAPLFGKRAVVLHSETDRPEAVAAGTVRHVAVDKSSIVAETERLPCGAQEHGRMGRSPAHLAMIRGHRASFKSNWSAWYEDAVPADPRRY